MSSSSIAAFPLHRAIRPEHRYYSSLASSLAPPRVLFPKILTPSRILSPISVPFAFTKAVNAEDKIRRTDGDENLLRVLEDKIDELSPLEAELPKDSPFEIIDKSGNRSIKLKREFQGEKIEVLVCKHFDRDADDEESEQDEESEHDEELFEEIEQDEESEQDEELFDAVEGQNANDAVEGQNTNDDCHPHISLVVTIDKAGPALRFWCNLYAEDFEIRRVMMKRPKDSDAEKAYKGFNYSGCRNLDEGLQRTLNEYLGARGIKVLCKFLWDFMTTGDRKYMDWLKNMKEFVEM